MGFECCYPGVKDANVMQNDQHLAEYNVFVPMQNPMCCAPLFCLLPWKKSGSLASSLLRKISKMKQTLPGPFSLNGCITTSDSHKVSNYFTSLRLFTKIVSMGCSFQKTDFLGEGQIFCKVYTSQNTQNATDFLGEGQIFCFRSTKKELVFNDNPRCLSFYFYKFDFQAWELPLRKKKKWNSLVGWGLYEMPLENWKGEKRKLNQQRARMVWGDCFLKPKWEGVCVWGGGVEGE